MGEIGFFVGPRGINDGRILSGGVLHVEVVFNCTMIDLFRSLVTPSSKAWTINALGPRLLDIVKCCRRFGHIFLV